MSFLQVVYASRPFGFDDAALNGILSDARRCNVRDGVTGALICRADLYLQLLEGAQAVVDETYARIAKDDRHDEVVLLVSRTVEARMFPDWAMKDDPARSWMWTAEEVADGSIGRATPAEVLSVFERVAAGG